MTPIPQESEAKLIILAEKYRGDADCAERAGLADLAENARKNAEHMEAGAAALAEVERLRGELAKAREEIGLRNALQADGLFP